MTIEAESSKPTGPVSLRNRVAIVVLGTVAAGVVATSLAVSFVHRTGTQAPAGEGSTSQSQAQVGTGSGVGSSQSVVGTGGTATAQGTATIASPGPPGNSSATSAAPIVAPQTVTEANDGATVVLHVGQQLTVNLSGGFLHWSEPQTMNSAVLAKVSGGTKADGSAFALFRADKVGQTSIVSAGNPACAPRCGVPSRLYQVTVTVVA